MNYLKNRNPEVQLSTHWIVIILSLVFIFHTSLAQVSWIDKRMSPVQIQYLLRVYAGDTSDYHVEIRIDRSSHLFHLAMATHNEYDDRNWQLVRNFRVICNSGPATFIKKDSALWEISIPGDQAIISYDMLLPGGTRYTHHPYLTSYGGLLGDLHSFMYIVENPEIPSTINIDLPNGWQIATGLEKSLKSGSYRASSARVLLDCPILMGNLHFWDFRMEGILHRIAYLPVHSAVIGFDSMLLLNHIQRIARQEMDLFGHIPYKEYEFLLEDGVYGALEHLNSVTIGAPQDWIQHSMKYLDEEIAHEYLHTWNLINIRPAEYSDLNYGVQERSGLLWFSEGLTMFYADLVLRRAALPLEDSNRLSHVEELINQYYTDTGNRVITPRVASLVSNDPQGFSGDYFASTHLQGELIGTMLDILIRSETGNKRSFDDVMRLMFDRFGGERGFQAGDIEQCCKQVCPVAEEQITAFFQQYIEKGLPLEFNPFLARMGLKLDISYRKAIDEQGHERVDRRMYIWKPADDSVYSIHIMHPNSCWARAGLHTGDRLLSIDGIPLKKRAEFNQWFGELKTGDQPSMGVLGQDGYHEIKILIEPYFAPVVRISKVPNPSPGTLALLEKWTSGE